MDAVRGRGHDHGRRDGATGRRATGSGGRRAAQDRSHRRHHGQPDVDGGDRVLQETAGGHRVPGDADEQSAGLDARHGRQDGPQRPGDGGRGRGRRRRPGPADRRVHHVRHIQLLQRPRGGGDRRRGSVRQPVRRHQRR